MKLINVLSILFFFAVTSCSMEDSMMSDTEKEMPVASDNQMVLSFTLNGGTTTKATGATEKPTDNEAAIKNCIIFLLDNSNNVIGVTKTSNYDFDMKNNKEVKILTKVRSNLRALAIVNSQVDFSTCKTYKAIVDKQITDNFTNFVKTGITDQFNIDNGSLSTLGDSVPTQNVSITVKQRTARIELVGFEINYQENPNAEKEIIASDYTSVSLYNIQSKTKVFAKDLSGLVSGEHQVPSENNKPVFYVYENDDNSSPTTMIIKYKTKANKKEKTLSIKIKTDNEDKVLAGNSYKITVKAVTNSVDVDATVTYQVEIFKSVDVDVPNFN